MPQIVASLTEDSRGIIYYRNIFIIQATGQFQQNGKLMKCTLLWTLQIPGVNVIKLFFSSSLMQ